MNNEVHKDIIVFRRLLFSKQIYEHGYIHSNQKGALNKMIAIHSYHNSIEILLRNILLKYEIRPEKQLNIEFEVMINEIDSFDLFKTQNLRIPNRQELRNLNQLRNWVQHHAIEPESSTMDYWTIFSKKFLIEAFANYFNEDFIKISSIDLITDVRLKSILEYSNKAIQNDNFILSANISKLAFVYSVYCLNSILPSKKYDSFRHNHGIIYSEGGQFIIQAITTTNERINEVQIFMILQSSGIELLDYKKFVEMSPEVLLGRGIPQFIEKNISREECEWLLNFVTDAIIKWEYLGFEPTVPTWEIENCDNYLKTF